MKIRFKRNKPSGDEVKRTEPKVVVGKDASPQNNIPLLKKLLKGWEASLKKLKGESVGVKQKRCYYLVEISAHKARIKILEAAA